MKHYRHPGGRIIHRGRGGRFRHSTLADIGMGCCEKCGAIFKPDYSDLGDCPDPRIMRDRAKLCPGCGGKGEQTGLVATSTIPDNEKINECVKKSESENGDPLKSGTLKGNEMLKNPGGDTIRKWENRICPSCGEDGVEVKDHPAGIVEVTCRECGFNECY